MIVSMILYKIAPRSLACNGSIFFLLNLIYRLKNYVAAYTSWCQKNKASKNVSYELNIV